VDWPRKAAHAPVSFPLLARRFACVRLCAFALRARTADRRVGQCERALTGPWKFHIGDNMAWAQPDFDDSAWGTMDLTPPPGSYDPIFGSRGFVPGWTARGYRGYSGYAWYRLRVNIQNGQTALALKMPGSFGDAYQAYVNGELIGQFGRFTPKGVAPYVNQPRAFPLPANVRSGPATVAIRMWTVKYKALVAQNTGGLHGPPVLGNASAIAGLVDLDWYAVTRSQYFYVLVIAIMLLALAVSFALFRLDSNEPAYLWLGLVCADFLAIRLLHTVVTFTTWIDQDTHYFLLALVSAPYTGLWVLFWAYWFRLRRMRLVQWAVWILIAAAAAHELMLKTPLYGTVVPVHAALWLSPLWFARNLLMGVLFAWVIYRGIRKNRFEGWLAAPAVVLVILTLYAYALHITGNLFAFGISIFPSDIALILSLIIVTVLLLRRFLHGQSEREQFKLELEQARQIQSLLVPAKAPPTRGFAVESVYLPATQVGGDFFHLRPGDDGSLLIVVGDVSGKGLKAAMTVSTIVGALRDYSVRAPAEILAHLNRVLHGQIKGFATCCATLIAADGTMTVANAGHIPPYRNGQGLSLDGDTPLGILPEVQYEEHRFQVSAGDRLTFVSDGIVEAMNAKRELFGFERMQQISDQTAQSIAHAAQQFGQEDDITVVSVVVEESKVVGSAPETASPASMQTVVESM
jgi:Stage II sporulation protein E (SpoIIE)/Beta-galactosidase jelly roll domain